MVINTVTIELRRTGETVSLLCQGRPLGVVMKITQEQLDQLIAEFAHFSAQWRATTERDPYHVLGVDRAASADDIKKAYRRLARRYHPDTSSDETTAAMTQLNEAYAVLGDPQQRRHYDDRLTA